MGNLFSWFYDTGVDEIFDEYEKTIRMQNDVILKLKHTNQQLKCSANNNTEQEQSVTNSICCVKDNKAYEYLVFSGGGIKGISYCGALEVLEEKKILYDELGILNIKGLAGASAGSIIAALLAIGYTPSELKKIMLDIDFAKLIDDKLGVIRDTVNFVKDYGIAPGEYFYNLIGEYVEKKTGNKDYTIDELYKDENVSLVIVGTDISCKQSIYFYPNHQDKNFHNVPIRKAVRISMSIPFLFEPVKFNGRLCVDGGVLDNFPLHVFDGEYPGDVIARLNLCPPNPHVLGLNIMSNEDMNNYVYHKKQDIDGLWDYSISYVSLLLTENEKRVMTPSYWQRTINILTPDFPLTNFNLTEKEKLDLIKRGEKSTIKFFKEEIKKEEK